MLFLTFYWLFHAGPARRERSSRTKGTSWRAGEMFVINVDLKIHSQSYIKRLPNTKIRQWVSKIVNPTYRPNNSLVLVMAACSSVDSFIMGIVSRWLFLWLKLCNFATHCLILIHSSLEATCNFHFKFAPVSCLNLFEFWKVSLFISLYKLKYNTRKIMGLSSNVRQQSARN